MNGAFSVEILSDNAVSPNLAANRRDIACAYPFPWRLEDGSVLCAYRVGRDKHSRDGVLMAQRSNDGGTTWSEPVEIYNGMREPYTPGQEESVHAGVLCEVAPEKVIAIFKVVEAKEPEAFIFSEAGRRLRHQLYVSCSLNGGRTWERPEPRDISGGPRDTYYGSMPLALGDGRFLVLVEGTGDHKEELILATTMSDGGRTFAPLSVCAHDSSGAVSFGDPRATQLPNGRIVMLLWTFTTAGERTLPVHRCWSDDGGSTWSAPASTGLSSQIASPLALDDGGMIAASNVRVSLEGIRLWFSRDAGESWSREPPIMMWDAREERMVGKPIIAPADGAKAVEEKIWDALPGFTFGIPELMRLDDDLLLLTYYATMRGITHIRACRFRARFPTA